MSKVLQVFVTVLLVAVAVMIGQIVEEIIFRLFEWVPSIVAGVFVFLVLKNAKHE